MQNRRNLFAAALLILCLVPAVSVSTLACAQAVAADKPALNLLNREQASAILPPTVFYRGKAAPIQGRNSAGIRYSGDRLVLATLVDTSGYSTSVQESYQAYLITEDNLHVGQITLKPGAYGIGIIAGNQMIVLDLGAHELFRTPAVHDTSLARPNPLQILPDQNLSTSARLYFGRNYVVLTPMP